MDKKNDRFDLAFDNDLVPDIFGRKIIARNLTRIIDNSKKGMTISINSGWGSGKSTFIGKWIKALESDENYETIYLDAWEGDYFRNPVYSIILAMENFLTDLDNANIKDVKNISLSILSNLISLLTKGLVDPKKLLKELNDSTPLRTIYSGMTDSKKIKDTLRESLKQVSSGKKVLFFVDELDRAKPSYVLELLEVIKHFFDIDDYYFILAADRENLNSIVENRYGSSVDTVGYYRKMIDLDYNLKKPQLEKYFKSNPLLKNEEFLRQGLIVDILRHHTVINDYSLRYVDKLYFYLEILFPMLGNQIQELHSPMSQYISIVIAILIAIRCKDPIDYMNITNNSDNINTLFIKYKIPQLLDTIYPNNDKLDYYMEQILRMNTSIVEYNNLCEIKISGDGYEIPLSSFFNWSTKKINCFEYIDFLNGIS